MVVSASFYCCHHVVEDDRQVNSSVTLNHWVFLVFFSQHQFFLSVLSDMNKDDLFLALLTAAAENTVQLVNVKPPAESKVRRRR